MNMNLTRYLPKAETVAAAFCELLEKQIGKAKLAEVIARNQTPEYSGGACASHDFCDANVVMDDAFKLCAGYSTGDTGGGDDAEQSGGCMSDACLVIWEMAWTMAKAAGFALPRNHYWLSFKPMGKRKMRVQVQCWRDVKELFLPDKSFGDVFGYQLAGPLMVRTRGGEIAMIM